MEAVCYSNKEAAARLLEANCDFNLREVKSGESALHVSVRKNYTTITDQLLTAGAALRPVYNYQVSITPNCSTYTKSGLAWQQTFYWP